MVRLDYKQTGPILISQMASSVQNLDCEFRVIPGANVTKNISSRALFRISRQKKTPPILE